MTELTEKLARIIREDFETDFPLIVQQMPSPPTNASPEEIMKHFGVICHRIAFMQGLAVGVEATRTYME